jgi:UDP-N-acetylmuramoyl-tripeptide--D-alanyl-D-alanine ligase
MAPEIRLTAQWVAAAMAGTLVGGDGAREFNGVSIDSRTLAPGALYVAIRGDRFDGADFAADAVAKGAAGVVVAGDRVGTAGGAAVTIAVADPTVALQALAGAVRTASGTKVVAITGSAGKTTTKEVTAAFLETKYRVMRNQGNLNNHIGLPLSLIGLTARPDVAVVELGMNHPGEIRTLVGIARPDIRVWTNVGDAHVGFFGSVDAIADAKAEILEGATADEVLVANADDDLIAARTSGFAGRVVTFGIERPATVRAEAIVDRGIAGMAARVATPQGPVELTTPLLGRGNLLNVLAATAVAVECGVPLAALADRASRLHAAPHRGEVIRLSKGIVGRADKWTESALASVSMGYQIGVTPLQMAAAISSVANGGEYVEPRVVRAFYRDNRRFEIKPNVVRRTITADTAAVLTSIMEGVVERGTAKPARIPGYTIAGKTGTAAKLVNRVYSKSDYNGSFVGFIPSRNPVVTILVVLDSPHGPHGYYGGNVSAPIFKHIAEETLRYLGVGPTINPQPPVLVAGDGAVDVSGPSDAPPQITVVRDNPGTMPDLQGLSARDALRRLVNLGLTARVQGNGFVVAQDPPAGTALDTVGQCRLTLDRQRVARYDRAQP